MATGVKDCLDVCRCCTWKAVELQEQCLQGYWIPINAPPDVVLRVTGRECVPKVPVDQGNATVTSLPTATNETEPSVNTWMYLMREASSYCRDIYKMPNWVDTSNVESTDL
jgi:hypothetical protein